MNGKPVILYIESAYGESNGPNSDRDALSFFLRNDCGCEVHLYDYLQSFAEDKNNVVKLVKGGWVVLVILKQHRYMESEHTEGIEFVRANLSKELPIVVLPDWHEARFKSSPEMPNVFAYDHEDRELVKLVRSLISKWTRPDDAFGVESDQERDLVCRQLQHAYEVNYLNGDSEAMLGTPDPNAQIVLEALRLRLLPIQFVKEEFDDTLPRRIQSFGMMDATVYEQEVQKIRSMTDAERKEFNDDMTRARGMIPCETGGVFCTGVGQGENAWGFAIDHLTLQSHVTDRFGEHQLAKYWLLERLKRIECMRTGDSLIDEEKIEYPCARRIIDGLILQKVNGFTTPIAYLFCDGDGPDECRRVADFILKERRFIPVSPYGFIFGTG